MRRAQYSGPGCAARRIVLLAAKASRTEDCPTCFRSCRALRSCAIDFCVTVRGAGARRSATGPHAFHLTNSDMVIAKTTQERPSHANPLEHSHYGRRGRYQRGQCTAHLHSHGLKTAPRGNFPAEQRSPFRRETGGHRRPVSESAEHALVLSLDRRGQIQVLTVLSRSAHRKRAVPIR